MCVGDVVRRCVGLMQRGKICQGLRETEELGLEMTYVFHHLSKIAAGLCPRFEGFKRIVDER